MELNQLGGIAIAFVFVAVVAVVGLNILSGIQTGFVTGAAGCNSTATTSCGYDYNVTTQGEQGLDELASWLPLIALVVAAAVVVGALMFLRQ